VAERAAWDAGQDDRNGSFRGIVRPRRLSLVVLGVMVMLRMLIGPDGLARTRFALAQLNLGATLLYHLGRSPDTVAPQWRARATDALGSGRLDLLADITMRAHTRVAPDFIAPDPVAYEAGLDAELHDVATTPTIRVAYEMMQILGNGCVYADGHAMRPSPLLLNTLDRGEQAFAETVAGQLQVMWEIVFAPDWPRIRAALEADIAYRSTRIARDGYAEMINSIDPWLTWQQGALCLARCAEHEVEADMLIFTPTPFGKYSLFTLDAPEAPLRRVPFISYPSMSPVVGRSRSQGAPAESSRPAVLLRDIHAFIDQNLANPDLCPAAIAAAHHISERYLYLVFAGQGTSVAAWIRDRRLQHCRQDLADPGMYSRPVAAIAARWGFTSAAHFNRVFRRTFGVAPGQYRLLALRDQTLQEKSIALQPALMTAGAQA
jgi:AraC-like DNA-binding protein